MSLSDPIGDMIARIKNAQVRNHKKVDLPSSNFKMKIADVLSGVTMREAGVSKVVSVNVESALEMASN